MKWLITVGNYVIYINILYNRYLPHGKKDIEDLTAQNVSTINSPRVKKWAKISYILHLVLKAELHFRNIMLFVLKIAQIVSLEDNNAQHKNVVNQIKANPVYIEIIVSGNFL